MLTGSTVHPCPAWALTEPVNITPRSTYRRLCGIPHKRRSRRSGRPAAGCTMDRPTGFPGRRSSPTLPHLRPRPAHCPHPTGDGLIARRGNTRPGASTTRDDRAVAPDHRVRAPRASWLTEKEGRIGDPVVSDRRTVQRWGRYADAITRWEHIIGRPAPAPALLNDADGPRPAPAFVEWLMGLPTGWVTNSDELTQNQQITALGNGVQPLQAALALSAMLD